MKASPVGTTQNALDQPLYAAREAAPNKQSTAHSEAKAAFMNSSFGTNSLRSPPPEGEGYAVPFRRNLNHELLLYLFFQTGFLFSSTARKPSATSCSAISWLR